MQWIQTLRAFLVPLLLRPLGKACAEWTTLIWTYDTKRCGGEDWDAEPSGRWEGEACVWGGGRTPWNNTWVKEVVPGGVGDES